MEIARLESAGKIYKSGESEVVALQPTNFKINSGELVLIIGPSGSGKTTLLHAIENYINDKKIIDIQVVYEPVKIWREIGLLDSFYRDPKRWSYTFQNIAFITKMMELDKLKDDIKNTWIKELADVEP